ncbi:MAG: AbrB/MazE/SpoVT family DNA-binding domain-containing protein [Pseudomonadota bacterium]
MPAATLRTVGGSVVMAIPKSLLEMAHLQAGSKVDIDFQKGRLIVVPQKKKQYKRADLLAQCKPEMPVTAEERDWLDAPAVGLEDGADDSSVAKVR